MVTFGVALVRSAPDGLAPSSFMHYFSITSLFGSYVLNHYHKFLDLYSIRIEYEWRDRDR